MVRLAILVLLLAGLFTAAKLSGALEGVTVESVRAKIQGAGPLGFLLYVAGFTAGLLVYVPGVLFIGAGILAYGKALGFVLALTASVIAVCGSFFVVRSVGGTALSEIERPFVRRMLAQLDRRPITTVAVLRVFFWTAPMLNYTLALSSVRFHNYLMGSVIGLIPPIAALSLFFEWLFVRVSAL